MHTVFVKWNGAYSGLRTARLAAEQAVNRHWRLRLEIQGENEWEGFYREGGLENTT